MKIPEKFAHLPRIIVASHQEERILHWWTSNWRRVQQEEYRVPFPSGVVVLKNDGVPGVPVVFMIFASKEDGILISLYLENRPSPFGVWKLDHKPVIVNGQPQFRITCRDEFTHLRDQLLQTTDIFLAIVHFILHFRTVKEVVDERQVQVPKVKVRDKKGKKSIRYIPSYVYEIKDLSIFDRLPAGKKEFQRHTDAWLVRGHYRRYKSGKIGWVKPYVKGDKSKLTTPEYRIKGDNLP